MKLKIIMLHYGSNDKCVAYSDKPTENYQQLLCSLYFI